jgi:hypothetical protein
MEYRLLRGLFFHGSTIRFFIAFHAALDQYRKGGSDLSVEVFNKEEKDSWLDHTFSKTDFNDTPLELREGAYKAPGYCWSSIILKETWVAIGKYDTTPFTQEQNNILRKFATAFDQAYTRFLDLQKAEAQARQARIEGGNGKGKIEGDGDAETCRAD